MGKTVSFNRPDGKSVNGYLAEPPTASKAPALVVIQEWWGLNDQIRGVADKLAKAGYRALVPDLYRGKTAADAKEANHLMTGLNFAMPPARISAARCNTSRRAAARRPASPVSAWAARSPCCRRSTSRRWTPA